MKIWTENCFLIRKMLTECGEPGLSPERQALLRQWDSPWGLQWVPSA